MNQLLTTRQAGEVLDMPIVTLNWWLRQEGFFVPIIPGTGKGSTKVLSCQQAWSVGIAKAIRGGGKDMDFCCEVASFLEDLAPDEIHRSFKKGESYLLLIEEDGEMSFVRRLTNGLVPETELINRKKEAEKKGIAFHYWYLNTKPMLDQILNAVPKKQTAAKPRTPRRS